MFNGLIATVDGGRGVGTINFAEYERLGRMVKNGALPHVREAELRVGLLRHMRDENIGTSADKKDMHGLPEFVDGYVTKHAKILENAKHPDENERKAYLHEHGLALPRKSHAGALGKKLHGAQKIDQALTAAQKALGRGSAMLELAQLCTSPSMTALAASLGALCASELAGQATEIILEVMDKRADTPGEKAACIEGLGITTELHNKDRHKQDLKDLGRREIEKPTGSDAVAVQLAELNPETDAARLDDALKLREKLTDKTLAIAAKPEKEQRMLAFAETGNEMTKNLAMTALQNPELQPGQPAKQHPHANNPFFIQTPRLDLKYKTAQAVIDNETAS